MKSLSRSLNCHRPVVDVANSICSSIYAPFGPRGTTRGAQEALGAVEASGCASDYGTASALIFAHAAARGFLHGLCLLDALSSDAHELLSNKLL